MFTVGRYGSSLGLIFFDWMDFIITPIFVYIFYRIVKYISKNKVRDEEQGKILMTAFWVKLGGTLAISLIYEFYYGGGDMESYYWGAESFMDSFFKDPDVFFKLLFIKGENILAMKGNSNESTIFFTYVTSKKYLSTPEFTVIKLSGLVSLITYHTFTANSLFFSMYSLFGSWKLFVLLQKLYPKLTREFSICCFYIPSIVFWGSGLLKDPITFGSLCIVVHAVYNLFVSLKFKITSIIEIFICSSLILLIKPYILLCAIPGLLSLVLFSHLKKIDLPVLKALALPFLLFVGSIAGYFLIDSLKDQMGKYAIDNLSTTLEAFQNWHYAEGDLYGATVYSLGDMTDISTFGLLKKIPLAINVTFFRPYIWESKKPVILLSALESLWFLILTLQTFRLVGVFGFFRILRSDPFITFCFIFAMTFGFAVGLSSYNFGALVRYKIPCMPFFLCTMYIIKNHYGAMLKKK
ncbi:MAG: hypothetical protein RI955_1880 [Bacteroidota bacterium]